MAAHGKQGLELMGKRQAEQLAFANLRILYDEIMGRKPSSKQTDSEANATAMVRQMVEVLEKAQRNPVKGVSGFLGDGVNHNVREAAVIDFAKKLYSLCVELGLSAKHKGVMDSVRALFVGQHKHK